MMEDHPCPWSMRSKQPRNTTILSKSENWNHFLHQESDPFSQTDLETTGSERGFCRKHGKQKERTHGRGWSKEQWRTSTKAKENSDGIFPLASISKEDFNLGWSPRVLTKTSTHGAVLQVAMLPTFAAKTGVEGVNAGGCFIIKNETSRNFRVRENYQFPAWDRASKISGNLQDFTGQRNCEMPGMSNMSNDERRGSTESADGLRSELGRNKSKGVTDPDKSSKQGILMVALTFAEGGGYYRAEPS